MSREFDYKLKDKEETKKALQDFQSLCKEQSRPAFTRLAKAAYSRAAACYADKNDALDAADRCFEKTILPLHSYGDEHRAAWNSGLQRFSDCVESIKGKNEEKLSRCFNEFASRTFEKAASIDAKYASSI